jgi:hypothetical protein
MSTATLCLDSVVCVDEIGNAIMEKFGNDEIYLAAIGVDSTGQAIKSPFFGVYSNFDDGEVKKYNPARRLVTLASDGPCHALLMLAEKQHGGMNQALDGAYEKTLEKLAAAKADGADPEKNDEGWTTVLIDVAKEVGAWLIKESKDKVFPVQQVSLQTNPGVSAFAGHDGKYRVSHHWEIS